MGISGRQGRSGRNAGRDAYLRAWRRVEHCGKGGLPRALHLRVARLSRFSSSHAALSVPSLDGHANRTRKSGAQMDTSQGLVCWADAASGCAARTPSARFDLKALIARLLRENHGATAIEYALLAGGISVVIISAVNLLGQNVNTLFYSKVAAAL